LHLCHVAAALSLVKFATGERRKIMYVATKSLPSVLRNALDSVGYCRKDVEIESAERTEARNSAYGNGYRGYVAVVNLATGERKLAEGAWGGSNMFGKRMVDDSDEQVELVPHVMAIIKGQEGGGRPVSARIVVHPLTMQLLLPAPSAEKLTADEQRVLDVFCGYKSSARREELAYDGCAQKHRVLAGPELEGIVAGLVERGYFASNKAGAISVTTKGKNAKSPRAGW
jgi:hypothetical protein